MCKNISQCWNLMLRWTQTKQCDWKIVRVTKGCRVYLFRDICGSQRCGALRGSFYEPKVKALQSFLSNCYLTGSSWVLQDSLVCGPEGTCYYFNEQELAFRETAGRLSSELLYFSLLSDLGQNTQIKLCIQPQNRGSRHCHGDISHRVSILFPPGVRWNFL